MAKLPDAIQYGIRSEDLGPLADQDGIEPLVRTTNQGLRSFYQALSGGSLGNSGGLTFADNFRCVVAFPKLTHGVPQVVNTGNLLCKGMIVLGADKGHVVLNWQVSGSSVPGQSKATVWFRDTSAANIACAVVMFTDGFYFSGAPKLVQPWQSLSSLFLNPWNSGTAVYIKDSLGFVHLNGSMTTAAGAAASASMFFLPVGYRPSKNVDLQFVCATNIAPGAVAGYNSVAISGNGNTYNVAAAPAGATYHLNNIVFLAEQ